MAPNYNSVDADNLAAAASEGRWISEAAGDVNRAKRRKLSQGKGLPPYPLAAPSSTSAKIDQSRVMWAISEDQTLRVSR